MDQILSIMTGGNWRRWGPAWAGLFPQSAKPDNWREGDMKRAGWHKLGCGLGVFLIALLTATAFFPGPAVAQVSPVPPGLVLPIGTTIRIWESGATDLTTPNSVNRILGFKYGVFSIDGAYGLYYASFPPNEGIPET